MSEWTDSLKCYLSVIAIHTHRQTVLHDVVSWMDYNNCMYWSI